MVNLQKNNSTPGVGRQVVYDKAVDMGIEIKTGAKRYAGSDRERDGEH